MVIQGYDRINWEDLPSQATPINAENLNHMEDGIERLYGAIGDIDLDAIAADIAEVKEEVENFQPGVELTQEEYDDLTEEEKNNGTIYYITDGDASAITAADAHYDNSTSGLTATDVQGAVDELKSFWDFPTAGFHNSIYRGKNLGSSVSAAQYGAIDAGTFENLFIGDYWEINSVIWRIAAFDYWLHHGDTECQTHHVVIVPDTNLATGKMNNSNTTTGGYVGSNYYTGANSNTLKATAKSAIEGAFGSAHILSHREYLTNAITNGYASAGSWYDSTIDLMNEVMVYGTDFFTPHNSLGATIPSAATIGTGQLPLFALDHSKICNLADWWLRDVASSTHFANVGNIGSCRYDVATNNRGVRPAFGIKA